MEPPQIVHSFSLGCSMLMFVKPSSPGIWFFRFFEAQQLYCSLILERNPRDISRGSLSLNAENHDHSLDFKCSTSAFSADGGISVTQEIVICDEAPLQKKPWKFSACCCWMLPCAVHDWDQVQSQLRGVACLLKAILATHISHWFPGPHRQTLGLLSCSHSSPSIRRLVCELALCPVHYAQVWLLATTFLTLTLWFVGIPSATWGTLASPVTCKNDSLHFAPSLDVSTGFQALPNQLTCIERPRHPPSAGTIAHAQLILHSFIKRGAGGAPGWQGLKAFSFESEGFDAELSSIFPPPPPHPQPAESLWLSCHPLGMEAHTQETNSKQRPHTSYSSHLLRATDCEERWIELGRKELSKAATIHEQSWGGLLCYLLK